MTLDPPLGGGATGEAERQAQRYGVALRERYGLTDLRLFAVVGIGLERVVWRIVTSSSSLPITTGEPG